MKSSPPLIGGRTNQKRRFGSPTFSSEDQNMDCSSSYTFQATKRRKRFNDTSVAAVGGENNNNFTTFQSKENWSLSPFATTKPLHEGTGKLFLTELPSYMYCIFVIVVHIIILTINVNCCNCHLIINLQHHPPRQHCRHPNALVRQVNTVMLHHQLHKRYKNCNRW